MTAVIYGLTAIIIGCYVVRWSCLWIIKRQRIDMAGERATFQQAALRALHITRRIALRCWKMSDWRLL